MRRFTWKKGLLVYCLLLTLAVIGRLSYEFYDRYREDGRYATRKREYVVTENASYRNGFPNAIDGRYYLSTQGTWIRSNLVVPYLALNWLNGEWQRKIAAEKVYAIEARNEADLQQAQDLFDLTTAAEVRIRWKAYDGTTFDLSQMRRQLADLDLNNTAFNDQTMPVIADLDELTVLQLRMTDITDAGMSQLRELHQLQKLNLARTAITDEGLGQLVPLADDGQLTHLTLDYCPLTDKGIEYLAQLPSLQQLSLGSIPLTDASVDSLSKLTSLTFLRIRYTDITRAGYARLQEQLPACTITY